MMAKVIVIIGGGLIGQQWAMLITSYKYDVVIYEVIKSQIENAKIEIEKSLAQFSKENISRSQESPEEQLKRIVFTENYDDLPKDSEFVIECVSENIEIKRNVFQIMDSYFSENTIRLSSSSFIPISKFTENLQNKSKCIIAHPINPPYFLRLVEIVPAPYTDDDCIAKTKTLMENICQVPVVFKKEVYGFAVNKIQAAVFNSIFKLINDDILQIHDIDKLMTEGLGPRWAFYGPLTVAILNGPGIDNYFQRYLAGLDEVNIAQNYAPQHDERIIKQIITETQTLNEMDDLKSFNEERNFNIGQILNTKLNKRN